jgi:hypothetical protein
MPEEAAHLEDDQKYVKGWEGLLGKCEGGSQVSLGLWGSKTKKFGCKSSNVAGCSVYCNSSSQEVEVGRSRSKASLGKSGRPYLRKKKLSWAPVAHTCNHSYAGGRDQENHSLKSAWTNSS